MRGPGRVRWAARVVSLTAANGGPAPVLLAGPAAGKNDFQHLNRDNFQAKRTQFSSKTNAPINHKPEQPRVMLWRVVGVLGSVEEMIFCSERPAEMVESKIFGSGHVSSVRTNSGVE